MHAYKIEKCSGLYAAEANKQWQASFESSSHRGLFVLVLLVTQTYY
jgi:hypothetical protein